MLKEIAVRMVVVGCVAMIAIGAICGARLGSASAQQAWDGRPEEIPAPAGEEELPSPVVGGGIKVIALDCFGTVYDLRGVPRDEVREYIRQVRREEWAPLDLPESWERLDAFKDSAEGIAKLRERFVVVTCANAPADMLERLAKRNGIVFDRIVPLERIPAYKPDERTYASVAEIMGVKPSEVLMVSGNEGSPDLTVPKKIGMRTMRIRGSEETPQTIIELAKELASE